MITLVYDNVLGEGDLGQADDGGIGEGDELATAVLISLFTDRRVGPDEAPASGERGGWWADAFPDEGDPDPIGSKLWLLMRGKLTPDAPVRARAHAREALAWMVDDGVAREVDAAATPNGRGRLDLEVIITLTDGTVRRYLFRT